MPSSSRSAHRIAIVGASSLRGRELKQVLEDRRFPVTDVVLLDESVMAGTLTEAVGEPTFIRALDEDSFAGAHFTFFAGNTTDTQKSWAAAQKAGATVIDMTGALAASAERKATPTTWIPSLASVLPARSGSGANGSPQRIAYASPSAAVIIACTLAAGLAGPEPQSESQLMSVLFFPPVSERDIPGVEELESQTAALLSFREIAKPVFDVQVAFNLLTAYGPASKPPSLGDTRSAIARDVAAYLEGRLPVPAIQLVQAPVFYGYAFAGYAQVRSTGSHEILQERFAKLGIEIAALDEPGPTNVSVADETEIHLARIEPDPNVSGGIWLWGAADGLRLEATNAVRIAEELVAASAH